MEASLENRKLSYYPQKFSRVDLFYHYFLLTVSRLGGVPFAVEG